MLAHIPPATTGFTARLVDALPLSPTPQLCVRWGYPSSPAMPESPFAPWRYYLAGGPVTRSSIGITQPSSLLRAHAPDHAPPPACGRPSVWGVCADCCEPLLRHGPSRRYLCVSVPRCVDPYPGGVVGARTHYFPTTIGLPPVLMGRLPAPIRSATSEREVISGLQSFTHVQASRFAATQVTPTVVSRHEAAVAFTSEQNTGRCLPVHRIC